MRLKSLKTGIAVNTAFFIFLSIVLADFVVLQVTEQRFIRNHVESTRSFLVNLSDGLEPENMDRSRIKDLFLSDNHKITGLLISTKKNEILNYGSIPATIQDHARRIHNQAILSPSSKISYAGRMWAVLGPKSPYAIISLPFKSFPGIITAVVPLSHVYSALRKAQKMAFGYLLLNFIFLSAIASWRISRMVTRPIDRLVRMTDSYQASEPQSWFAEGQKDEFSRLSGALNQMLSRIEEDRVRLRHSLAGLEQANRDLKSAQNEIIRAEKLASIGRMSANLAHEIGNPIGIVLGYLGLLKKTSNNYNDHTTMDYISRAESEIQRVHEVVKGLLDFSRKRESVKEIVELHSLIREVGEMLSCQPLFSKICVKYSLNADNDKIYGDASGLYQVIVNLMINSADSICESENATSGQISLETACIPKPGDQSGSGVKHDFIEFKITDNGAGIRKEYFDQIFDPFFTTKESGRGTGLGLSVSFMIIEQMGGEMDLADSKPGFTQMVIRLPLDADTGNTCHDASGRNSVLKNGAHQ